MNTGYELITDIILYGGEGLLFYRMLVPFLETSQVSVHRRRAELLVTVLPYLVLRMVMTRSTWVQQLFYGEQMYIINSRDTIISAACSFLIRLCAALILFGNKKRLVFYLTFIFMAISEMVRFGVFCLTRWLPEAAFFVINQSLLETGNITMEQYYAVAKGIQVGWNLLFFGLYLLGMTWVTGRYRRYLLQTKRLPRGYEIIYLMMPAMVSLCFSFLLRSILLFEQDGQIHSIFDGNLALYG